MHSVNLKDTNQNQHDLFTEITVSIAVSEVENHLAGPETCREISKPDK